MRDCNFLSAYDTTITGKSLRQKRCWRGRESTLKYCTWFDLTYVVTQKKGGGGGGGGAKTHASFARSMITFKTNFISYPRVLAIPAIKAKRNGK